MWRSNTSWESTIFVSPAVALQVWAKEKGEQKKKEIKDNTCTTSYECTKRVSESWEVAIAERENENICYRVLHRKTPKASKQAYIIFSTATQDFDMFVMLKACLSNGNYLEHRFIISSLSFCFLCAAAAVAVAFCCCCCLCNCKVVAHHCGTTLFDSMRGSAPHHTAIKFIKLKLKRANERKNSAAYRRLLFATC